eukprot:gene307-1117_t
MAVVWTEYTDTTSRKSFFYNTVTKEVTWEDPRTVWTSEIDPSTGETYYANKKSRETTWADPRVVWKHCQSEKGQEYWVNEQSGESTWNDPRLTWTEHSDPVSGKAYFHNSTASLTTWENPHEELVLNEIGKYAGKGDDGQWWPITLVRRNGDGTYNCQVHDAYGRSENDVQWENVRFTYLINILKVESALLKNDAAKPLVVAATSAAVPFISQDCCPPVSSCQTTASNNTGQDMEHDLGSLAMAASQLDLGNFMEDSAEGDADVMYQSNLQPSPSLGSQYHDSGHCQPCVWYYAPRGCKFGNTCRFCHMCPSTEIRKRRRDKKRRGLNGNVNPPRSNLINNTFQGMYVNTNELGIGNYQPPQQQRQQQQQQQSSSGGFEQLQSLPLTLANLC